MKLANIKNAFVKYRNSIWFLSILYVILGAVLYFSAINNVKPEKLNISLLSIAEQTIHSPMTIVDSEATERRRQEAASQVEDVYVHHVEYEQNRIEIINSVFDAIEEVNREVGTEDNEPVRMTPEEKIAQIKEKIPVNVNVFDALNDEGILTLLSISEEELNVARISLVTSVHNIMGTNITISGVNKAREQIVEELSYANVSEKTKKVLKPLGKYAVVSNYFFDASATKEKKRMAEESVDSVYILQGQVLIREGETITRSIYSQLQLVNLVDNAVSYQPYIGLLLLVALIIFFVHFQSRALNFEKKEQSMYVCVYVIVVSATIGIMKGISTFQQIDYTLIGYLVPVGMGTMLVYLLAHPRLVGIAGITFAVFGSILFNEGVTGSLNFSMGIYYLFSSLSVPLFLRTRKKNTLLLRAGLFVSLINVLTITAIALLKSGHYSLSEIGIYGLLAIASGMLSSILTIGVLPYLEDTFGMVSDMKLIDLSSPNHPLLRKILLEAPGTYHHSIMVANLSEAACEAVGANGLLARVGAYYHDIGKTVHPYYFIENQMGMRNPHDDLTPEESKDIIITHVTDGVEILRQARMPKEIIDICQQHHGTTFLKYFYVKAKEIGDNITEDDFRYAGPIPHTKESAIVGIADSVEAAVRSLTPPTPENIEKLVNAIVNDRLQDGQFNYCDLTMKELQLIKRSLCETLNGTFHSRIKYPELKNRE